MGGTLVWSETLGVEQGVRHGAPVAPSNTLEQFVEACPAHVDGVTTAAGGAAGKSR